MGIGSSDGTGLIHKIPKYLLSQDTPLFLKWRYLPTLAPWLVKFLSHANETGAKAASDGLAPILSDAVEQHKALAAGTSAQDWIADSAFGYACTKPIQIFNMMRTVGQ